MTPLTLFWYVLAVAIGLFAGAILATIARGVWRIGEAYVTGLLMVDERAVKPKPKRTWFRRRAAKA